MKQTFRQSMAWLHTWTGLSVSWLLFFIFVMGTVSYFDRELDGWMRPEYPVSYERTTPGQMLDKSVAHLQSKNTVNQWYITMPSERNPSLVVEWDAPEVTDGSIPKEDNIISVTEAFAEGNPETGTAESWVTARETNGGNGLYRMHYRLHYLDYLTAYWIVTIASMIMLIGIVSGVIVHKKIFKDFFTFRLLRSQLFSSME